MSKYLPKILIGLALVGGFALPANSTLAFSVIEFQSGCGPVISSGPLFSEVNFLPGNSKTCWIKATNLSPDTTERIAIEARNFPDPILDNDLARALNIEIKNDGTTLYGANGTKSLYDFYEDSGIPNDEDNREVYLGSLEPNSPTQRYDITISFPTDKGDYWQGKTTRFDIVWGFQMETDSGSNPVGGNNTSGGGFSGFGGTGGYYDESGAKVAGVASESAGASAENLDGAHLGNGQSRVVAQAEAGSVLGETVQGQNEIGSTMGEPSSSASAGTCEKIWWWPIGYLVYLILILAVTFIGSGGKPFKVWRLLSQIILAAGSLTWWLFEPCGTLIWWQPVALVLIFVAAVTWYLREVVAYQKGIDNSTNSA